MEKRETTRLRLGAYAQEHPEIVKMTELAAIMGITYQRVQQINASEHFINLRQRGDLFCRDCHCLVGQGLFQTETRCEDCHGKYIQQLKDKNKITVTCSICGKSFILLLSDYRSRLKSKIREGEDLYCSRRCWGKYVGKHYGRRR